MLRYGSTIYRAAGIRDIANLVVSYLWDWIYQAGITKEQVLGWFGRFLKCNLTTTADVLPSDLVNKIAKIMASVKWNCGDFIIALEDALETPPAGYRWRTDSLGKHTLVKVKSDVEEKAIVKGKRFATSVFIGAWWTTTEPRGAANQAFQRFIRKHDGAVFWNEPKAPGRQYGAFLIADHNEAEAVANQLCALADRVDLEGAGEHRLSAISMVGIAEHRSVLASDQIWVGCIRSIKFNWKYSLPDLLNGRIEDFRSSRQYKDLIRLIREK